MLVFNSAFSADPIKFNQCTIDSSEPIHPIEITVSPDPPVSVGNVFTISGNFSFGFPNDEFDFDTIRPNGQSLGFNCDTMDQCNLESDSFTANITFNLADLAITSGQNNLTVSVKRYDDEKKTFQVLGCLNAIINAPPPSERGM
ncbi:hypothetical protein C2G38_2229891 [Gigaspora rosea]|uniref:MD-2-related lipid-recognition domain-containing protein n=1 Tax=Gigaspora rosea TaxID=44941 RepID=A0A397TY31_9GLOM|nr:hypothetical protein C2G38_2229891 [Gigaspora rosea]